MGGITPPPLRIQPPGCPSPIKYLLFYAKNAKFRRIATFGYFSASRSNSFLPNRNYTVCAVSLSVNYIILKTKVVTKEKLRRVGKAEKWSVVLWERSALRTFFCLLIVRNIFIQ
jgi:hypothetical protein